MDDLFGDLRPAHNRIAGESEAESSRAASAGSAAQADKSEQSRDIPPDEVQSALAAAAEPKAMGEEAATLLKLSREAHDRGDLAGLHAGLEQYDQLLAERPELVTWEGEHLQIRLALLEGRTDSAPADYEQLYARGYAPTEAAIEPEIDGLLAGVPEEAAAALKVSLMLRALAPFRKKRDRAAMDRLYSRVTALQEPLGDPRRMISHLKGHLTIREALEDVPGQLDLIDRLGKLHFELKEAVPARQYYEKGVHLRAQDAAVEAPGGEPEKTEPPVAEPPGTGAAPEADSGPIPGSSPRGEPFAKDGASSVATDGAENESGEDAPDPAESPEPKTGGESVSS